MVFLRVILLDTLMQIFVMLRHLVAEISRFKFDDYPVIRTRANDLKHFVGGVYTIDGNLFVCAVVCVEIESIKTTSIWRC